MGCKCKEKAAAASKYADDKNTLVKIKGLKKIPWMIGRLVIVIFSFGLIIIGLPFIILSVLYNTFLGRTTQINLKRFLRKK